MTESTKNSGSRAGFSRRDFLRGSSAVAAASALHAQQAEAQQAGGATIVRGATPIELNVNGQSRKVTVEPRTTLLEALRYQLDLTAAKPVCTDGSSGAATVLIDGKPMQANTLLAVACVGKKIETAEAFAAKPDAVCKAFVEYDAQQCGFCTPGFVVAVRAFLDKNPKASDAEIRAGLNGNICRCGTYANIVQAAIAIVKGGN